MNIYQYKGEMRTVKELASMAGISEASFRDRIRRGFSVEEAVKENPTHASILHFIRASWWEDWVDMSVDYLYQIYWLWCIQKGYTPETKQGFSRQLFTHFPWLKIVPIKKGEKCLRMIRKREVNL